MNIRVTAGRPNIALDIERAWNKSNRPFVRDHEGHTRNVQGPLQVYSVSTPRNNMSAVSVEFICGRKLIKIAAPAVTCAVAIDVPENTPYLP